MKKLIIEGNKKLSGSIKISGAKNSVVALIPAAMLTDGKCTIYNVPNISDIDENATIATYGLDSLDVVEFLIELEDKFNVSFDSEDTKNIKTVGELINLVTSQIK